MCTNYRVRVPHVSYVNILMARVLHASFINLLGAELSYVPYIKAAPWDDINFRFLFCNEVVYPTDHDFIFYGIF